MLPFFASLVSQTDEARRAFETNPMIQQGVAEGLPLERYRALLLELYHVVWHFNPICAAAASRLPDEHRAVRYYLYEHLHEEKGHEEWVMNDLAALSVPEAVVRSHAPSLHTHSLVAVNYYNADRGHPCAVLGMLYVLEVIASVYGGAFASAIRERLLLHGEQGVSFIGSHAEMDQGHMASLRALLNTVKDGTAQAAITASALANFHHLTRIMESV
jgi:pyrroloquinoline quinone (PQQ) biosynthesis protein C